MDIYGLKAWWKSIGFKMKNNKEQKHQVVFVGDSLTARCDLKRFYPTYNTVNRGISGDALSHLKRRMNCSVYDLCPCAIVFLMGINDLAFYGLSAKELFDIQESVFAEWREKYPDMPIIVQSLYPVADDNLAEFKLPENLNETVNKVNEGLKYLTEKFSLTYVDVHSMLLKNGKLDRSLAVDCLHLNDKGYEIVSRAVGSALDEHLNKKI